MSDETRRLRLKTEDGGPKFGKRLAVTDAETGVPFPVVSLRYESDPESVDRLTVTTYEAEVDIEADATVVRLCPVCGKAKALQQAFLATLRDLADAMDEIANDGGGHFDESSARQSAATLRAAVEAFLPAPVA